LSRRKSEDRCQNCLLRNEDCLCSELQSCRLSSKHKLTLVAHIKDYRKPTNSGRLFHEILEDSELHLVGEKNKVLHLSSLEDNSYEHLLLCVDDEAEEWTKEKFQSLNKPIHFLVPDGNWSQARRIKNKISKHPFVKKICLVSKEKNESVLRLESKEHGLSTFQAIAEAYRITGDLKLYEEAMTLYSLFVQRVLISRGVKGEGSTDFS